MYDDRMEFLSVGGLAPGISLDAVMSGVSHTRNEGLANVFYHLELVEAYGTGIARIMSELCRLCQQAGNQSHRHQFLVGSPKVASWAGERPAER
ncbi:MAG: hypothetical protein LBP92_09605 [Deltaproteobacteria bacterium]|nr:hypothetical protein [Deltaproteobacteria bacterium]